MIRENLTIIRTYQVYPLRHRTVSEKASKAEEEMRGQHQRVDRREAGKHSWLRNIRLRPHNHSDYGRGEGEGICNLIQADGWTV